MAVTEWKMFLPYVKCTETTYIQLTSKSEHIKDKTMGCNNGLLGNKIISILYFFATIHVQLAETEDYLEASVLPSAMSMPLTAAVNDDDVLHLPSLFSRSPISSSDASSREEPVRRSSLIFLYSS